MKKFKLDFSFVILLGIISLSPKQNLALKLFLCLFLHELGHLIFVLIFRYKIHSLKLSIFGFFLELDRTKEVFYKDFFIYLGGILSNLLCYILIPDPQIKTMSLILIIFNSLPIYPLDGFNVVKTLAAYIFPYRFVLVGMSYLSLLCSMLSFLICMYYKMDVFLLINAFYLILLSIEY
ncbi:MAG: hypothetical protein K2O22_01095, partial [Anaeroplasmataceae bacterium]|nr:hypothetical protein [Anaeroplasmataceae bacterium]